MGANSANGKIYISAEVIDNFKQLASEVKNGLSQAAKEAKLEIEVDDKSTQQAIETSLKNINNYLSKAKFKKIDYGKILPNFNDFLGDESITGNDKLAAADALEQTLSNIDKYGSKIHQSLINSLDADGVQKYFKQLNSVMKYLVDNFSSNYEQLFNTIATNKGFDFDALFNLDTLVKGKNGYLVEDYFGTLDDLKKNITKEYKKYNSFGLSDAEYMVSLEKIAGLKSALETMTGGGLEDIFDDKDLVDDINAAVNSIEHDYGKAVADAIKRIELDVSNMILDSLDNIDDIQKGIKSYDINSILNTDNSYNSELDKFFKRKVKEQKTPSAKDVIDKTIKGEEEPTDYSYIYDNETEAAERLKNKIKEVHKAIDNKTSALELEKDKMSEVVNAEIKELDRLERKFGSITNQDYSNTPLLTDEGGELFTIYRLVSNAVNPHSPNPAYGGTDFSSTSPDMAKGMTGRNWKQYKANFKAKNPLILDARGHWYHDLPKDLVENYDTETQFLLDLLKDETRSTEKNLNSEFGSRLEFTSDFEILDNVNGDLLQSNDDLKEYFNQIIANSKDKEKIIDDAIKKIRDTQKKLQDKKKEIISNDTLPHWSDFPEGDSFGLDNDMLARWLKMQDVYDAIIIKNIQDSSEHNPSKAIKGTNVLLKDFNKQAYNVSLNDAGGSDAYLKTVEEEVASVYSKVEEKIDSIVSKLDGIKFPINIEPEIVVDKESISEAKIDKAVSEISGDSNYEDIIPDDIIDDIVPDNLESYVEDFVFTIQEKLSNEYIEDILETFANDNNGKFITSNGGHQNNGIYQDDKITAIIRDGDYEGKVKALMPALEEAYKKGANVARILDYIIDDEDNLIEIQETASGKLIGGNDDDGEWLEATDEQILKLIKDFKILQETGLYFDTGGENLLYDKDKGFSIIDLAKPKDENNIPFYNTNDYWDLFSYFEKYGANFAFSEKLTNAQNLVEEEKYSSNTSEMLNELADSIDKKIDETFESKKQTLQKALDLIKSKNILLEEDGTFDGSSIEALETELENMIDNMENVPSIPTGIVDYYHKKAQKIIASAKDLEGLFGKDLLKKDDEEFEIDDLAEFEADFTDISEPLSTAIDNKVDEVIEEKKKKIQEAIKILSSLSMVDYHDNYLDDVGQDYYDLVYDFGNMDLYDEDEISELSEHAQKIIDKYNLLNKTVIKESSDTLSEIEKTVPSVGDFVKSIHGKVLTSDEIDGVLSGGKKGKDPFSKPSWLKPAKPTPTKTSIDTAKAKEEVTEANKDLEKSTSPSIEALDKESVALENIEDSANKAALKKEEFAKAESLVYGATEKTIPMLDDEDTMFASLDASISNATASLNNFAEAHDKINRLNDINANIQIDNNGNNNQNNSKDNNRNVNNTIKPYTSLEQMSNEDIIKNYENIGGTLPNIINKNLKGAINKLDTPSFEDLLDEGYQSYRQSFVQMFESMSEDDLISEYGNIVGDDLSKSITLGMTKGIDSIDFDNTSDILLSKLMEEQREINEAEENYINSINNVEKQYSKLSESKSYYTGSDVSVFDLKKYTDKDIDPKGRINQATILSKELSKVKKELNNEFNDEGKISGSVNEDRVKHIQELIDKYNDLIDKIKQLKDIIKSPESIENIELDLKKQANTVQKQLQSGKYEKFSKQTLDAINKYSYYDAGGNITGQTAPQINELKKELENYNSIIEKIKTANTDQQFIKLGEEAKEAQLKIKELTEDLKEMSSPAATKNQTTSLAKQISGFMDKNTRISVEARSELQSYFNTLMSGATVSSDALNNMAQRFKEVKIAEEQAGRLGGDIFNQMVGKMREGIAYLTTKVSAYEIFNQFRQGFEIIHQFDDALTEMMKVSDETRLSLERYQKTTFDTADAIGTSALQIQNSTADFMRLGETLDQAAESAKSANVLMNVSEFQSIDEATKSLIAMGAAYDDLSKMNIIDKLNEVGNNYAISTSEAAEALQSSASALKTAGNDMDEALALITAGNAVVQDANKVGTGMRTIALRLTGTKSAKEELEEMGEETENVITTQSKLRDTIKEATAVASNGFKGFDILDENGNYKSTYEIMLGIADVYDEIAETDKQFGRNNLNLLLESVAGIRE